MSVTFKRPQFFIVLFIVLVAPLSLYKLNWILHSEASIGIVQFTGHGNLGSVLGISTYQVILFKAGRDSILFNGNVDAGLKNNEPIEIRYQPGDPTDARMNTFMSLWGDTMAYSLGPILVFLAVFFSNEIIPRRSQVQVGANPFIKLILKDS